MPSLLGRPARLALAGIATSCLVPSVLPAHGQDVRLLQWMEHDLAGPGGAMPPMDVQYEQPAGTARP